MKAKKKYNRFVQITPTDVDNALKSLELKSIKKSWRDESSSYGIICQEIGRKNTLQNRLKIRNIITRGVKGNVQSRSPKEKFRSPEYCGVFKVRKSKLSLNLSSKSREKSKLIRNDSSGKNRSSDNEVVKDRLVKETGDTERIVEEKSCRYEENKDNIGKTNAPIDDNHDHDVKDDDDSNEPLNDNIIDGDVKENDEAHKPIDDDNHIDHNVNDDDDANEALNDYIIDGDVKENDDAHEPISDNHIDHDVNDDDDANDPIYNNYTIDDGKKDDDDDDDDDDDKLETRECFEDHVNMDENVAKEPKRLGKKDIETSMECAEEPVCPQTHPFKDISKNTIENMFAVEIIDGYFTKEIAKEASFSVNKAEWTKLTLKTNKRCFNKGVWDNVFMSEVNKLNPFCTFMIKRHQVNRPQKRSQKQGVRLFYADLYCKFSDCSMKCKLEMFNEDQVKATFCGNLKHDIEEIQARPISGKARENLRLFFNQGPKPFKHFLDKFSEIPDDVKIAGNFSPVGRTKSVFQKIASESNYMSILDKDETTSLIMMASEMRKKTESEKIKGFIQHISLIPSCIMYWSENSIRLWHELGKNNIAFWDATGSVLRKREGISKYLYYELAVANPKEGGSTIPITSMISSSHATPQVKYWLGEFRRHEKLLFGHANAISPRQIISDRSMVFLLSALAEFNSETIDSFRSRAWRIVNGHFSDIDLLKMNPHGCLSHVMKDFKALCNTYYKSNYEYGMFMLSLLVNSEDLTTASKTLSSVMHLLLSRYLRPRTITAFDYLSERMDKLPGTQIEDENFEEELLTEVLLKENINPNRFTEEEFILRNTKNEFYLWAQAIKERVLDEINESNDESQELNSRYCPELANQIIKRYVSTFPIWSNILLGDLNRHKTSSMPITTGSEKSRKTNAIIEQRFRDLKFICLAQKQTTRLDEFSKSLADHVINIQKLAVLYCLKTRRKTLKRGSQLVEEEWDKKGEIRDNITVGKYQKKPKTPFVASKVKKDLPQQSKTSPIKLSRSQTSCEGKKVELPKIPPPAYGSTEMIEGHALQLFRSESRFMNVTTQFSASSYLHDFYINISKQTTDINLLQRFKDTNLGIENLGNSCWFNAVVQLLKDSVIMRDAEDKFLTDLFFENDLSTVLEVFHRAAIAEEVTDYHAQLALGALNHSYDLRIGRQNDAHEFLTKVIFHFMEIIGSNHDLKMRETTVCAHCSNSSGHEQVYRDIQLNVANTDIRANESIVDLLDQYFNDEEVKDISCCIGFHKWKSVRITSFPAEMFITIIRLNNRMEKVRKPISVDPLINMGKYTDASSDVLYRFKGAVIHYGRGPRVGHYVAIKRVGIYDILIDDERIEWNKDKCLSTDGYILLYEKVYTEQPYVSQLPTAMIGLLETKGMTNLADEGTNNSTYSSRKQEILKMAAKIKIRDTAVEHSSIIYKLLNDGLKSLLLTANNESTAEILCSIILYLFGTNPLKIKEKFGITYVKVCSCQTCNVMSKRECHDIIFDDVSINQSERCCRNCGNPSQNVNIVVTNVGETIFWKYSEQMQEENGINDLLCKLTYILPIESMHYQSKCIVTKDATAIFRKPDVGNTATNLFIDSEHKVENLNRDDLLNRIPLENSIVMADKTTASFRKQYKIIATNYHAFDEYVEVCLDIDENSDRFIKRFSDELVVEKLKLTVTDVQRFLTNEFNDINIDAFLEVLKFQNADLQEGNCVFEPAGFYGSRLTTSEINYYESGKNWFASSLIIIPVNIENVHWILIAIVISEKTIFYMDPLGHSPDKSVLDRLYAYLAFKSVMDTNTIIADNWSVRDLTQAAVFPKQTDNSSCGAMVCLYAKMLTQKIRPTQMSEMAIRKFILHEIVTLYYTNIESNEFGLKNVLLTNDLDKLVSSIMTGSRDFTGRHQAFLENPDALNRQKLSGFGLEFLTLPQQYAIQTHLNQTYIKHIHRPGRLSENETIFSEAVELNNLLRKNICYAGWYVDIVLVKEVLIELLHRFKKMDRQEIDEACKNDTMKQEVKRIREIKRAGKKL